MTNKTVVSPMRTVVPPNLETPLLQQQREPSIIHTVSNPVLNPAFYPQQTPPNTPVLDVRNVESPVMTQPLQPSRLVGRVGGIVQSMTDLFGRPPTREMLSSQRSWLLTKSQAGGGRQHFLERFARIVTMFVSQNWYWVRFIFVVVGLALAPILLGPLLIF